MSRVYLSPPDVGDAERNALLAAFDSGWIAPVGPDVDGFERDVEALIGWPGVVALSSGTAALHLALLSVGVERGDHVLLSSFTFAATANAVRYCGAIPAFVDSEPSSWNMNPDLLAEALTVAASTNRLPKAVVVVDLYGQCADYERIIPICHGYDVAVIEDSAEALGATYRGRPAGSLADVAVLSFNGNKIITTSGGGMLLSPNRSVADRARYLATQARQSAVHYEHTEIGYNYRLSNLLAAVGRAQLSRLPTIINRRLEINRQYVDAFSNVPVGFMPIPEWSGWNGWLSCVVFETRRARDLVMAALDQENIESRPLWKPMHLQPVFASETAVVDGTSEDLFNRGLCLPSGSVLNNTDIERVAKIVTETCS